LSSTFWQSLATPHSQLYAEPERLAAAGYVAERREEKGRRRRTFSITSRGRRELMRWLTDPRSEIGVEVRDAGLLKLFFGDLVEEGDVVALAHALERLHQRRASEYERIADQFDGDGATRFRAASLRMGLIYERASVRFWRSISEELTPQERRR